MKNYILSISVTFFIVLMLTNSAVADVAFVTDSIYVTCVDKGDNRYEIFGHEITLPKDFFKRVSKSEGYDKPDIDNGQAAATADNICRVAAYYLQNNDIAQAKALFEQAYKKDPTNYSAQNGYLRFHIEELIKKVIDKPDNFKKTFDTFKKSGDVVIKEYLTTTYLRLIYLFNNEKNKKRIISKIVSDIKSQRSKLEKLTKKDAEKNKDEITKIFNLARGIFYEPTKNEYLLRNKYTEDYINIIDVLAKMAELFEVQESFKESNAVLMKKLVPYLTSSEIGAVLNKKINDDNQKNRESNAKFAAASKEQREVILLMNDYREILGLKRLLIDSKLAKAASDHAYIMERTKTLSHENKDGEGPTDRVKKYGYDPELVAENIQKSASSDDTPETIFYNWLFSEEHYANMINEDAVEVGIGNSGVYWVQLFGSPAKK